MPKKKTYHHGDLKNALIKAGVEILAKDGVSGLSLRKVAMQGGSKSLCAVFAFRRQAGLDRGDFHGRISSAV